jgi:RsiW-degrading membrane proteinase PrsW (M82 family)/CRP-like cAMP-binding protein
MSVTTIIAYIIALAIPIAAIYIINALDLFQTAKRRTLLVCLGWGVIAFGIAYVANTAIFNALANSMPRADATALITRFIAPVLEEVLKALFLIYLIRQPVFRYFVDGAVYGFCIGIGFAVVENMFYISNHQSVALSLAATRALSTSLMHGTSAALVGISIGMLRRSTSRFPVTPIIGIVLAVGIHIAFNNIVNTLEGVPLLLVAIGIGLGGSAFIAFQVRQGLKQEKQRFAKVLNKKSAGVATGEMMAIQRMGSQSSDTITELQQALGDENLALIQRMLVTQANIGILKNNLNATNVSPRLRKAWEEEIALREKEFLSIRGELNRTVLTYLQNVFPPSDQQMQQWVTNDFAAQDPTMINMFDVFMFQTGLAAEYTPEQLIAQAERLHRIEIFRDIDLANLENLGRSIQTEKFEPGAMLFDQGAEGDAMYLIEDGSIDIFAVDRDGNERFLRTFQPGQVVGDFAVLDGQKRSARARASKGAPLTALILQRENFKLFIQSRPQSIRSVLRVLGEKARFTTTTVEENVRALRSIAIGDYEAVVARAAPTAPIVAAASGESPIVNQQVLQVENDDEANETEISYSVQGRLAQTFARLAANLQNQETQTAAANS